MGRLIDWPVEFSVSRLIDWLVGFFRSIVWSVDWLIVRSFDWLIDNRPWRILSWKLTMSLWKDVWFVCWRKSVQVGFYSSKRWTLTRFFSTDVFLGKDWHFFPFIILIQYFLFKIFLKLNWRSGFDFQPETTLPRNSQQHLAPRTALEHPLLGAGLSNAPPRCMCRLCQENALYLLIWNHFMELWCILSGCFRFSPQDGQSFVFPFDPIPPTNSEEKDEWDLRVHLSPPERRSGAVHPLGPVVPPVANGPADTVMQMVFNATGEFLRQLLPSTAAATAGVETVIWRNFG